ncbi:hypothetical protein OAO87_00235 [bacterium]|nr:hypothetical protein [bacterium]
MFDIIDDDLVVTILRLLTRARDSKSASRVCKRWLLVARDVWKMRLASVASEGLMWRPSLAVEIEAHLERNDENDGEEAEEENDAVRTHLKRVQALPFVMGLTPAPAAAMWAKTKPTLTGGQQVYIDDNGEERNGLWGCNESVSDFGCDSNWNRGFVWGVIMGGK